ncbi:MAG: isoprenylcysteine carboxylmethyltransferase family protein [Candidatus Tumulicola sp.]
MSVLWIVLILVAAQRIVELAYARANTIRLLRSGGVESGATHYPLFVLLHAAWLIAMVLSIPPATPPIWWLIAVFAALQAARVWIVATLGPRWTTRVVTVPNAAPIRRGPYRFFRHPNYIVVCAEIAVLPLAFHAVQIALVFSLLNAALLSWRVRVEDHALGR